MSKDVTMRDIAAKLNMSAVSVSKAISGKEGVSEPVRDLILKTAAEMGYEYTSTKNKKNRANIAVLVSQAYISENAFYSKLFQNITTDLGKNGHSCSLEIISSRDEKEGSLPGSITFGKVDGILVMGPLSEKCMERLLRVDIPCVYVDNYTPDDTIDCVVSDNVYGSHMLTNYLIKKGHREIAFVGAVNATNSIMDRYLGYLKGLMQNGINVRPEYTLSDRDEYGFLKDVEIPECVPDAFVCNCDEVAYRLIEQLKKIGIKVPENVSVVGFDDYIFATVSNPQLTTFRVNLEEMSRASVELMEEKLKNKNALTGRIVISGQIIIRDSVR